MSNDYFKGDISWNRITNVLVSMFVCLWRHVLGRTPDVTNKKKIFVSKKLQYSKMFCYFRRALTNLAL